MNKLKRLLFILAIVGTGNQAYAQFDESGIAAGFFDSSNDKEINFSEFHLPPLAILFENAKANPQILSLEKARQLAQAEVAKEKRHIFSYLRAHASYSYGIGDSWGTSENAYSPMLTQYQGTKNNYWNLGASLSLPLEDILDLTASVKRKKLEVDQAVLAKDAAFDQLKLEIATLFVRITNNLVALKATGEASAAYMGAGSLNREDFENGNQSISAYAFDKQREVGSVQAYQSLQTSITTDIITLEILTHTPIITNSTTEITLDEKTNKSSKEIAKENKAVEKRIKKAIKEEDKKEKKLEKAEAKAEKAAAKAAKKKNN
jgi:Outer membrane protein